MISTLALASLTVAFTVAFTVASVTPCPTDAVYAIVPTQTRASASPRLMKERSGSHRRTRPAPRHVRGNLNNSLRYSWAMSL